MTKNRYTEQDYVVSQKFDANKLDYKKAHNYISGLDLFAEATNSCYFIFDYYKHNYLYINSFNEYLPNISSAISNPYLFFNEQIEPSNRHLIHQIHHRAFKQVYRLPLSARKNLVLEYNCQMRNSQNKFAMTDITLKTIETDIKGSIWLVLFIIKKSESPCYKVPTITNKRTGQLFEFDFNQKILNKLTATELKIIPLIFSKMTNEDIANELDIKKATLRAHLYNIYGKAGVRNRLALQSELLL